jgi:hypothetical protein
MGDHLMLILVSGTTEKSVGQVYVSGGAPMGIIAKKRTDSFSVCPLGACQILLSFVHNTAAYLPLTYDRSTDEIRVAGSTDRVCAILSPCDVDENGNVTPCAIGDLHSVELFGGAL